MAHEPPVRFREDAAASISLGSAPKRAAVLILVVYLLVWTGLDWVAGQYLVTRGVSLWYAPAAVDAVLLLVLGLRWAPALLLTVALHALLLAPAGLHGWQVGVLAAVTAASYTTGAAVLTRKLKVDVRLLKLRDVVCLLLVMCLTVPLPVALAQVWLLNGVGAVAPGELPQGVFGFWAGSATGVAMLAPVLLIAARRWPTIGRPAPDLSVHTAHRPARLELIGQVLLLAVAVWAGFANSRGSLDYSYLVYGPLMWIGLRGGFVPAAAAVLAINVGAVALNRGQLPAQGGFALQFGLVTLTVLGVLLGAAVTQRQANAETDRRAALRDPLTRLANRVLLHDRIAQALARHSRRDGAGSDRRGHAGVVMFLDLDRFKQINDTLGHDAGDAVLGEVAHRLEAATRPDDTVARLGGDEFAILLEDDHDLDQVQAAAHRVLAAVDAPLQIPAGIVHLSASIGSAPLTPGPATAATSSPIKEVLRQADIALHRAKRQGRNQHVHFDVSMHEHAVAVREREDSLRDAVDRGDVTVDFQPIVAMPARRIVGAEALARWRRPNGESVPPQDFIATAEDSGVIIPLGRSVLRQACAAATRWPPVPGATPDSDPPRVTVNASAVEVAHPGYADSVLAVLQETGLAPHRLELEITETQWVNQSAATTTALTRLTAAGIHLVLDDFGTGYSSFSHLADMPVTGVKIDRSFVSAATSSVRSASIVRAILCMAAELDLEVTAEGVETEAEWDFLVEHRCDRAQGFLLGRPQPNFPSRAPGQVLGKTPSVQTE